MGGCGAGDGGVLGIEFFIAIKEVLLTTADEINKLITDLFLNSSDIAADK